MPTGQKLPTVEVSEHSHGAGTEGAGAAPVSKLHGFASTNVADFAIPHGREEEWRFTPLDRLRGLHDGTAPNSGKVLLDVDAPAGVTVSSVERGDPRIGRAGTPTDRVAAAAWTAAEGATVITVPAETTPDRPILLRLRGEAGQGAAYGHLVVEVEPLAEAVVVLDHSGSATYADNVELVVGDGAKLTLVSVQDWADDAVHLSHHFIRVGRDASVRSVVVTFGGDLVRIYPQVNYSGPNGEVELLGLYFADAGQHLEHRLFVDHAVPHCRSRVSYKGALQGKDAHTVWIGDVLIRKEAVGTDTYELNRNLVLTDGARADSVPNLEIETGEIVGAGHASATGRFDDEQLFYLQSRGIPSIEARRLVVRGFFAELIARIGVPEVEERLITAVEAELEAVLG
ncbi:MAG: Fe-S cluster assembly protein SufD [Sporichthyaceae bacterium]|nr:Fe-S cluster assembly protein SufD [Sporichthyaceae bacterium]